MWPALAPDMSIVFRNPRGACGLTCLLAMLSNAGAAPFGPSPEDRYIATRDAVIEKFAHDAGKFDDKAEEEARAGLQAQMSAILGELKRSGFGPATLNLVTLYKGDQDYGMLDGLRLDAEVGTSGEKAGQNRADGKYVWPRAHIIVTTQTIFERWLRAHKDWWSKDLKNVPQQIGLALKDESFYTQAISTDAAVVSFHALPIARPAAATFAYGILAARTQSEIPDAADQVFVSALANGKVYIAYGSIRPKVQIVACSAIRAGYNKRAEAGGDDAFKRCFAQRAPQQPSFAEATKQAQALLAMAIGLQ
jgi:hypothetical protein